MRLRLRYAALLALTLVAGLLVRFTLHLPPVVSKYGGSALWAMAIFWLVSLLASQSSTARRVLTSLLLAFAVEFFKLVRTPALDAFRLTLPGKLLLGRYFSLSDLIAYTLAIVATAMLDRAFFRAGRTSAVR